MKTLIGLAVVVAILLAALLVATGETAQDAGGSGIDWAKAQFEDGSEVAGSGMDGVCREHYGAGASWNESTGTCQW